MPCRGAEPPLRGTYIFNPIFQLQLNNELKFLRFTFLASLITYLLIPLTPYFFKDYRAVLAFLRHFQLVQIKYEQTFRYYCSNQCLLWVESDL